MPGDPKQPLTTTITPAPKIAGTTTTARAARKAEEREPSATTLAMMPGASDLARELGIKSGKFAPQAKTKEDDADQEDDAEEDDAEEEDNDSPEDEDEDGEGEGEEEGADAGTEDGETEGKAEEEEDGEGETEEEEKQLPPEAVAIRDKMQKRIDKLTAKNTDALEELEELRGQLAEMKSGPRPSRTAENPLADVLSAKELEDAVTEARQIKRWAIQNRDGGELPGGKDGETQAFDAKEVATMLANAEAILDAAPERQQWLADQGKAEAIARQAAPDFFKAGTPHKQVLDKVWAEVPAAVKAWRPDAKLMIIQMLIGTAVMREQQQKKAPVTEGEDGKRKPQVSAKKVPPSPGAKVAPKTTTKVVDQRKRKEQLKNISTGGHRQLTAAIADRLKF